MFGSINDIPHYRPDEDVDWYDKDEDDEDDDGEE